MNWAREVFSVTRTLTNIYRGTFSASSEKVSGDESIERAKLLKVGVGSSGWASDGHKFESCQKWINQVAPLTCKSGSANRIHSPLGLYEPCALYIYLYVSLCHPKTNKLLNTSLCLLLHLTETNRVKLEVDQRSGTTYLQGDDPAIGSNDL